MIDPTFCGSRFSTGRLLTIEDFSFNFGTQNLHCTVLSVIIIAEMSWLANFCLLKMIIVKVHASYSFINSKYLEYQWFVVIFLI